MSKKQQVLIGIGGAMVLIIAIVLAWPRVSSREIKAEETPSSTPEFNFFSSLDGSGVLTEEAVKPLVVAVMIDNHPWARPQSGLGEARVVYEAPAEGGITRFLAIFNKNQTVEKIGPVRSARPYYLDWMQEYGNPPYLHVGGSPEALRLLKQRGLWDVDQFFWPYFWRSTDRLAPHNVYTSSDMWNKLFDDYGARHPAQAWDGWRFAEATLASASTSSLKEISIKYGSDYIVTWKLDEMSKRYVRHINGSPHLDRGGQQLSADTIVIQTTQVAILDDVGRREIQTVGSGEARMVVNGQLIHGTWKKDSLASRTRYYDAEGKEVVFASGQTWVQVVPTGTMVEIGN